MGYAAPHFMSTSTSLESWLEWKGQCALSKCSESVQTNLAGYGAPITKKFFHTFDPDLSIPGESAMDQWHLLESYMHTTSGVTGKRWKDWLFERAAGSSDDTVL